MKSKNVFAFSDEQTKALEERLKERLLFDLNAAAEMLSISRRELQRYIVAGKVSSVKLGRRHMVSRAALEKFLASIDGSAA